MADRSVTVRLDADIAPFVSAMAKAEAAARKLRDSLGGDIKVGADTSAATTGINAVQRDADRLARSNPRVRVDADTAAAQSGLKRVDSDVARLTGRSARVKVDADVSGALSSIALVAAALASLPAVTSISVAVGALGGAFAAAGAGAAGFAAVAVPSLGRINEALQQQASAAGGAGGATKSAAQSAAEAASRALQLEQAERRVADAQKGVRQAQEDLTRARRDAKRALEDYSLSVKDAALAEEDAALAVEEARARLAEVEADPEATELERKRAELNHRQAIQRLEEQSVRTKRLQEDKADADRKGVEGSDQVRAAQDRLLQSQADLAEAQKALTVLQLQQKAAMQQAGSSAASAASKFAQLSKAEQALARDIKEFTDGYIAWQRSLQPDVFPVIRSGLDLLNTGMKISTPLVKSSSKAFKELIDEMNAGLKSEQWTGFFDDLAETAPRAIEGLGRSAGNVAGGLAGIIQAFLPYTDDLMDFLEEATQGFEDWGQSLKGSPEFEAFIAYVRENGPKVAEVLGNVAVFAGKVVELGAGVGSNLLDFLVTLSDKLAGMDSAQIEAIARGVGLIVAAVKLGATLKLGGLVVLAELLAEMSPGQIQALAVAIGAVILAVKSYQAVTGAVGFFQNLSGSIDGTGKAADGAKGKLSALAGLIGKGGVIAAAAAGTVLAIDSIADALDGLNPDIDKLAKGLADFGAGGAPAAELLDQLDAKTFSVAGKFETFAESASRLASDNTFLKLSNQINALIDDNLPVSVDGGRQAIQNLDQALTTMVSNGQGEQAAAAFTRLAKQATDAGVPMSKLKELFPEYASSLEGALPGTNNMAVAMGLLGVQVDPVAAAMQNFNSSLDAFNAKTDVAERTLALKDAFNEAKTAIEQAGGKMDVTAQMTDKQRLAVIQAREQFSGYIGKVLEAARAAGEMAGKTGDAALKSDEAREAFIRQIPQLFALAGKSSEAREQVYKLAEGFGVSRKDADRAKDGVDGVRDTISKLKGRKVDVGVDNKQGLAAVNELRLKILELTTANVKLQLQAVINKNKAMGGIDRYAAGGIARMAAGGLRPQPPSLVSKPTVLFGEGSSGTGATEAFIPYESKFRDRAISLLGQVADDFGLSLYNKSAGQQIAGLGESIILSSDQLGVHMGGAIDALDATLGQAGSLTGALDGVAGSAEEMAALVSVSMSGAADTVAGSIDGLSESVSALSDAVAAADGAASSASKGKKKSAKDVWQDELDQLQGLLGGKSKSAAGKPKPIVWGDSQIGVALGGGIDMPTNYSKVSKPQMAYGGGYGPPASYGTGGGSAGGGAGSAPQVVKQINFNGGQTITKEADADMLFAKAALHLGDR